MSTEVWISTTLPRRVLAVRRKAREEVELPRCNGPFGALLLPFDATIRPETLEALEAGIACVPGTLGVGGPGAPISWGDSWAPELEWHLSPEKSLDHYLNSTILGMGMQVTTFVVLALDANDRDWQTVLDATRQALTVPDWRLHAAANAGREADVRTAIADGWPIDDFDSSLAWTPLHNAAHGGHLEIVRLLLEAGANVNAHLEERIGETPLGLVADDCSAEMANLLMDAGADPTIPGWMQITALDRAKGRTDPIGRKVYERLAAYPRRT